MHDSERVVLPVQQTQGRSAVRTKGEFLVFNCLIVSNDPERQEMLAHAAAESGWEAEVCGDAASALNRQRRMFAQLAIVDLESDESGAMHELLEHFSRASGLLTVVCGHEADMEEEIWARQIGVWLYLPGVTQETNVSLLCGEARHVVERLHAAANAPARTKVALRKAH